MLRVQAVIFVFSVIAVSTAYCVYKNINNKEDLVDPWRGIQQF